MGSWKSVRGRVWLGLSGWHKFWQELSWAMRYCGPYLGYFASALNMNYNNGLCRIIAAFSTLVYEKAGRTDYETDFDKMASPNCSQHYAYSRQWL
jgi:hypothetical protein